MQASAAVDIARYSAIPGEGELLVLPGSEFEVSGVLSPASGLHIIQLTQQPYHPLRLQSVCYPRVYHPSRHEVEVFNFFSCPSRCPSLISRYPF